MDFRLQQYQEINMENGRKVTDYEIVRICGDLIYFKVDEKMGVMKYDSRNMKPSVIIEPKYMIYDFHDGYAVAYLNKEYLIINEEDKVIRKLSLLKFFNAYLGEGMYSFHHYLYNIETDELYHTDNTYMSDFKNGRAISDGIKGPLLIDKKNNILNKHKYSQIEYLDDNLYLVERNNKWGIINLDGEELIRPQYVRIIKLTGDYFIVIDKHFNSGIINLYNKVILPIKYKKGILMMLNDNSFLTIDSKDNHMVKVNRQGQILEKFEREIYRVNTYGSYNVVWTDLGGNIIGPDGEFMLDEFYNYINVIGEGVFLLENSKIYNAVTKTYSKSYNHIIDKFNQGFIRMYNDNTIGIVDVQGKELIEPVPYNVLGLDETNEVIQKTQKYILVSKDIRNQLPSGNKPKTNYAIFDYNYRMITPWFQAQSVQLLDQDYVIINNYLFMISDLKIDYCLDLIYTKQNEVIQNKKVFKSLADRDQILNSIAFNALNDLAEEKPVQKRMVL